MHMEISTVTPISKVTTAIMSMTPASFVNGKKKDPHHILIKQVTNEVTWSNIAMTNLCLTPSHLYSTPTKPHTDLVTHSFYYISSSDLF